VPAPAASVGPEPLASAAASVSGQAGGRGERREPVSRIRARIAQRLVEAQHQAALLTTFNEINMQPVVELRNRHRERFEKTHGVRLGFMSFFARAAVEALKRFPAVNAYLESDAVVYHDYYDVGIAVGSPRGLVVPVVRDVDRLSFAEIERAISDFAERAKDGRLKPDDLVGGTFTITNGGVFGSLLSTPIVNPPQSAILGLHKIEDRPVAENGQVVIRPMMYVALTYDHRLIDGRDAVQFLVAIKEAVEDPARMLLGI
jgi:2-oxoglutarate dehydrogenase E2 component (dihydrolipoamide succinyltransferase)